MPKKKLRVAGYCRTSGEGQRDNTSIPRQKESIESFCKSQGWTLTGFYIDECKSGSKTTGRDEYQRMMADAANRRFDLVIPYNATRFGRDGVDILTDAKFLKQNFGIHTIGVMDGFDTRENKNVLNNFVQAGVSEWERLNIMDRMIGGKVRSSREGVPCNGRLPYARTYDRKTGEWGLDEEKANLIRELADRFLKGESLRTLSEDFPLSYSQLWKTFRYSLGSKYKVTYDVPELQMEETFVYDVPRLLPEKTIRAIHERLETNKRFSAHGKAKYLLGGRIYCAECGFLMTGTRKPNGKRLYRHAFKQGQNGCPIRPRPTVNADKIELEVVAALFDLFGNPAAMDMAVKDAIPEREKLIKQRDRLNKEFENIKKARTRTLDLIERDSVSVDTIESKLKDLDKRQEQAEEKQARIAEQLEALQETEEIRFGHTIIQAILDDYLALHGDDPAPEKHWDEKRRLIESCFPGKMPDGTPEGVYITSSNGPQEFTFELKGRIDTSSPSSDRRRSTLH